MSNNFKPGLDRQMWVQTYPTPNAHAAGQGMCCDLRNNWQCNPYVDQLISNAVLNRYHKVQKTWALAVAPSLGGTFGAGAGCAYAPSLALVGTIAAGATTTSVILSTALPTAPGVNMLANRGDRTGFVLRIIGYAAGKTEERVIVANTASSTPTITVDQAFSFTPAANDRYEILSGRVFMLGAAAQAANQFRSFEVATNTLSASLSETNLPATIQTEFSTVVLDEQYTPYDHQPGEGMVVGTSTYDAGVTTPTNYSKHCLIATASAASTITGQASAGDAVVAANEYRNFNIRIVYDASTPASVGQRRQIASHTAGPSPVYTLGTAWTTQPSATASYVIELPNIIVLFSSGTTSTYLYNYGDTAYNNGTFSIASAAWNAAAIGARGGAMAAGCTTFGSWGIEPDVARNARHSFIYSFRGGGSATLDLLDWAGGTAPTWTSAITYDGSGSATINTGACGKYAPATENGQFGYMNGYVNGAVNQLFRFDVKNRTLDPFTPTDWIQAGAAAVGDRIVTYPVFNGTEVYTIVLLISHLATNAMEIVIQA